MTAAKRRARKDARQCEASRASPDMDAMTSEFETVGQVAVCPKCGAEVRRSDGEPTAEEAKGFAWWNSLDDEGRAYWLGRAGGPGRSVFHAWTVYRAAETGSPGGDGVS